MRKMVLIIMVLVACCGYLAIDSQANSSSPWTEPEIILDEIDNRTVHYPNAEVGPDGTIYLSVTDSMGDHWLIKSKNGRNYTEPVKINSVSRDFYYLEHSDMLVDPSGNIHFTYIKAYKKDLLNMDMPLWYTSSEDNGSTFAESKVLLDYEPTYFIRYPQLAFNHINGRLSIVAIFSGNYSGPGKSGNDSIQIIHSDDMGDTWTDPITILEQPSSFEFRNLDVCVGPNGTIHIVYERWNRSIHRIFYIKSTSFDSSQPTEVIPWLIENPKRGKPRVLVDTYGQIHIFFIEEVTEPGIGYITSDDKGNSFDNSSFVTQGGFSVYSAILDSLNRLHCVYWFQSSQDVVLYRSSLQNESSFRSPTNTSCTNASWTAWNIETIVGTNGDLHVYTSLPHNVGMEPFITHFSLPNPPPIVEIHDLNETEVVHDLQVIDFSAVPGDNMSSISRIEVRIGNDTSWIHVSDTSPALYTWDTTELPDGPVTVYARAWDGWVWSEVDQVTVNVRNNEPPRIIITSPTEGSTYQEDLPLTGSIADDRGFQDGWFVERSWDGENWTDLSEAVLTNDTHVDFEATLDISTMERGEWVLRVRASDGILTSEALEVHVNLTWLPDLRVDGDGILLEPPDPKPGDSCTIEIPIRNDGKGTALPANVTVGLNGEVVSSSLRTPTLGPGENSTLTFQWEAVEGRANFTVTVDADEQVVESDEDNNSVDQEYTIEEDDGDGQGIPDSYLVLAVAALLVLGILFAARRVSKR